MRKLALLFLVLTLPLVSQERELRGTVTDDATPAGECPGEKLLRLAADGIIPLECLPTATVELQWEVPEAQIAVGDVSPQHLPNFQAGTVGTINCKTIGASTDVSVNFDARNKTTPGTPGTDVHTSEIVADPDNTELAAPLGDTTIAENEELWMTISAVTGTPTKLYCSVSVEAL